MFTYHPTVERVSSTTVLQDKIGWLRGEVPAPELQVPKGYHGEANAAVIQEVGG